MISVSVSQITTAEHCERKWGFTYIEGHRESNAFAHLGTDIHAQLERWLQDGVPPDDSEAGQIAESGLHYWPAPRSPSVRVEISIGVANRLLMKNAGWLRVCPDGFEYGMVGFQDVDIVDTDVVVGDHKSTTDFKWAKTRDDLLNDVQAATYALAAMDRHNVDSVLLRWVYYRTRGARKSMKVETWMDRETAEEILVRRADPIARKILEWRMTPGLRALDLVPNVNACSDYGGCVHRERCGLTARDRLKGKIAHMDLKAKMQAKLAANKTETPAAPADKQSVNPPEKAKVAPQAAAPKAPAPKGPTAAEKAAAAKAEAEARAAAEAAELARLEAEAEAELAAQEAVKHEPNPQTIGYLPMTTLYIGCLPMNGGCLLACDVIEVCHEALCRDNDVVDYRLIEFGKGAGMLVAMVGSELASRDWADYYLDPSNDIERVCMDAFIHHAGHVVRRVG